MTGLTDLMNDHQMFHSDFQIDHFIVGGGGTVYGRYKQCLREVTKRWRGLKVTHIELERKRLKARRIQTDICRTRGELDGGTSIAMEVLELDLMEANMQLEDSERAIRGTYREFQRFYRHAVALKEQIGELTDEKRAKLDTEMWAYNVKARAAVEYMTRGGLSDGTIDMLHKFPPGIREETIAAVCGSAEDVQELKRWFENDVPFTELPALPPPSEDTKLIEATELPTLESILCLSTSP